MNLALNILKNTPIWVWVILLLVIIIGSRQLRSRVVKPAIIWIAPIFFLAIGLLSNQRSAWIFLAWGLALTAGFVIASAALKPSPLAYRDAQTNLLHIPGSAAPLILMLAIFLVNYGLNVTYAVNSALRTDALWQFLPPVVSGVLSGIFAGRAWGLFNVGKRRSAV